MTEAPDVRSRLDSTQELSRTVANSTNDVVLAPFFPVPFPRGPSKSRFDKYRVFGCMLNSIHGRFGLSDVLGKSLSASN